MAHSCQPLVGEEEKERRRQSWWCWMTTLIYLHPANPHSDPNPMMPTRQSTSSLHTDLRWRKNSHWCTRGQCSATPVLVTGCAALLLWLLNCTRWSVREDAWKALPPLPFGGSPVAVFVAAGRTPTPDPTMQLCASRRENTHSNF